MKQFLVLIMMLVSLKSWGLAVDEKLPLRILKTSKSAKTILINRGLEDGLVVGNHAKFFLTKGVVARGVVVKASPTRTVWSLYRVIDARDIKADRVLNLKITTPVKLTEDPTKMLSNEDLPQYNRGRLKYYNDSTIPYYQGRVSPVYPGEPVPQYYYNGLPVTKGGKDIDDLELRALVDGPKQEIEDYAFKGYDFDKGYVPYGDRIEELESGIVRTENADYIPDIKNRYYLSHRDWEINSSFHFNSLSSSVDTETETSQSSGDLSTLDISIGIDKYFPHTDGWWRKFSIGAFIHLADQTTAGIRDVSVDTSLFEYGLSVNWHLRDPFEVDTFNPYATFTAGLGTVSDSYTENIEDFDSETLDGSATFFSFGGGIKYLTRHAFGFKGHIDYYRRGESYNFDDEDTITKVVSGPRLILGGFYRW